MRRPGGYAVITSPEEMRVNFDHLRCEEIRPGIYETDTLNCGHCGRVVHVGPRVKMDDIGGFCRNCMKSICGACCDKPCEPLEAKLLRWELESKLARQRAVEAYGT